MDSPGLEAASGARFPGRAEREGIAALLIFILHEIK
jgi:hypothetical protein